jgi:glycosyltransferase 2 family protein
MSKRDQPSSGQPALPGKSIWGAVLAAAATLLGSYLLYRTVSRYDAAEIVSTIASASPTRLAAACGFGAASYLCLTGFDWLALRYAGRPLPYRQAAWASFTALSLGHNIGFAALSSGAIRYRFYSRWGLSTFEVGKVILFCGVTVGLGLATLGGSAMLLQPGMGGRILGVQPSIASLVGGLCLAIPGAYLWAAHVGMRRLSFRKWSLEFPSLKTAAQQIGLGVLNFSLVAACLHQALNAFSDVSYPTVATVYVIANAAALASHVPGGLGVIESTVLFLLPNQSTIAAVLIFRFVYFLMPLTFGLASLLLSEVFSAKISRERRATVCRNPGGAET